jgi:hypothetical protein
MSNCYAVERNLIAFVMEKRIAPLPIELVEALSKYASFDRLRVTRFPSWFFGRSLSHT